MVVEERIDGAGMKKGYGWGRDRRGPMDGDQDNGEVDIFSRLEWGPVRNRVGVKMGMGW